MRAVGLAMLALCACFLPTMGGGGASDDESTGTTDDTFPTTSFTSSASTSSTGTSTSADGTEGSTSASTVDPTTDGGDSFIVLPDGGVCHCACDILAQDCPTGEKCMPWANDGGDDWNATKCVPLASDGGQPGDPCTVEGSPVSGLDDCDGTSMCFYVDPATNIGECVGFCEGQTDPACPNADACTTCLIANDGVLMVCVPRCDPLAQDCGPGRSCHFGSGDAQFICLPDQTGDGALGDPCETVSACDPGLLCADAETVPGCRGELGCCAALCDTSGVDPCAAARPGTTCLPIWEPGEEPDGTCTPPTVGVCVPP